MKTTKGMVELAFKALIKEIGGRVATRFDDHGAYSLDYVGCYGGYVIERICADSSGVWHPFGQQRHSAKEAYDQYWFAVEVLRQVRQEHIAKCPSMGDGCAHFTAKGDNK